VVEIDTVLIKAVSRCNISCQYCYVYNMGDLSWVDLPRQMSSATMITVANALGTLAQVQHRRFAVVLHGGEPLMLGHARLDSLLTALRKALPVEYPCSIQTNGTLITQAILDVCAEHYTSLGVSIDGPRDVHDCHRVGYRGEGTYAKVLAGIAKLRNHQDASFLYAGVLAVIDPTSDPHNVYSFFKALGPPSIDFLYRDGNHSQLPYGKVSVQSTEYGQWLTKLLDVYLADPTPIPIRVLDDMIKLLIGGSGAKEGIGATDFGIVIIDTDGAIRKSDTLKSAFCGADRFEQSWSVHTHQLMDVAQSPEFARYYALQQPTAPVCLACPELRVCGGGMPVNRWRDANGYNNPYIVPISSC
jgi:uncharacterized protein